MTEKHLGIKRVKLLGTAVAVTSPEEAAERLAAEKEGRKGKYITFCNVHTLMTLRKDPDYRAAQQEACVVMPDGKPLAWCLKKRGHGDACQVAGPDFMRRMLEKGGRHYFYGASPETLEKLENVVRERYPQTVVAGMEAPPFRKLEEEEERAAVDRMNEARADYIWIGLGAPKQEYFMQRNAKFAEGVMLGVGAAFDFHAGTVERAPEWMRSLGLEWLYRLLQDPGRLWKRYLVTNTEFAALMPFYLGHRMISRKTNRREHD